MSFVSRSRRLAGSVYETLLAPLGSRALSAMLDDGLPPRLEPALRYLFTGQASANAEDAALRIEHLRAGIGRQPNTYRYVYSDTSLGPVRLAEQTQGPDGGLSSHRLAMEISVPRRWGMFLHLCAEAFDANVILEMGAAVGISGAYLASIPSRPHLLTLEGSQPLAMIAQATIAAVSDNAKVVGGPFEQTLPQTLNRLGANDQRLDVAFIDGHHEEAATMRYVEMISSHLSPSALMILDDIYLYEGMWRVWQTLSSAGNAIAINVGRFGLLVHDSGETGRRYDLARYTGRWRVGGTRAHAIAEAGP